MRITRTWFISTAGFYIQLHVLEGVTFKMDVNFGKDLPAKIIQMTMVKHNSFHCITGQLL